MTWSGIELNRKTRKPPMSPTPSKLLSLLRLAFSILAGVAMAVQLHESLTGKHFPVLNFFSFFTIQSNLLAVFILLVGALLPQRSSAAPSWDLWRGAAVLYLSITGVVYGLLLSGYQEALQTTIPWVDTVLHRLMPLLVVVDWLVDPPRRSEMSYAHCARRWAIYPLAYAAYALVRGPYAHWYPYPFLNPQTVGGYGVVALYCLGITVVTLLFSWLVVIVGRGCRLRIER